MIKITLIAPYRELAEFAIKIFNEHISCGLEKSSGMQQTDYEFEAVISLADDVQKLSLDTDVIIARGITADVLKNRDKYIPIVEIPVTGNDIMRGLYKSRDLYGDKKIAIVGSQNVVLGVEHLSEITGIKIKAFGLSKPEDYPETVDLVKEQGYEVLVGGVKTCEYGNKIGLKPVLLETGKESLWQAITEAKRIAHISRIEKEKALLLKNILDYAYEGVIALNNKNEITLINSSALKTLPFLSPDLSGTKLDAVMPDTKLKSILESEEQHIDQLVKYNEMQLTLNKVPIRINDENVGNLIMFQDITKIQEMESKIRNKIYARGHVARYTFDNIVGESDCIKKVIRFSKGVSQVDSNILIFGETGTGKELFAQSIHNCSPRKDGPFVAVNCAALPESLLESELFGYNEGAFTGALKGGRIGLFELAHKGTIFLDEISEISLKLQSRLLRVIQEKEIMRLGDSKVIPVDVRIISATNKDLKQLISDGGFREDLYYRLDVLKIKIPPLRERMEDMPLLAQNFIKGYGLKLKKQNMSISAEALVMLRDLSFPGNIRELKNICEKLCVLSESCEIGVEDVTNVFSMEEYREHCPRKSDCGDRGSNMAKSRQSSKYVPDRKCIEEALKEAKYSRIKAAQALGVSRSTLYRWMKDLNIES